MCFVGGVVGVGTNSHRGVDRYSVKTSSKRPPKGLYSARIQYSDRIPSVKGVIRAILDRRAKLASELSRRA